MAFAIDPRGNIYQSVPPGRSCKFLFVSTNIREHSRAACPGTSSTKLAIGTLSPPFWLMGRAGPD
jgi:hypothetical protein